MKSYGAVNPSEDELEPLGGADLDSLSASEERLQRKRWWWCKASMISLGVLAFGLLPFAIMMHERNSHPEMYRVKHFSIFFIRHAEKPPEAYNDPKHYNHLSEEGWARAKSYYPNLFCDHASEEEEECEFLTNAATHLVARDAEHPNFTYREIETLEPLSTVLSLPIERVTLPMVPALISELFETGRFIGEPDSSPIAAVISWEHRNLRKLGRHFGCSKAKKSRKKATCPDQLMAWPDEDFGSVVEFKYRYTEKSAANKKEPHMYETVTYNTNDLDTVLSGNADWTGAGG
ncbi:hypothetical protein TeGR_g14814 [Tetraparma gracilis]|uniref:Uncharacterized protein n=1 Tax=Tetraparma gracilis TaxID=2962635 RepID=A0ABQ6MU29_9STRA|nr:hypothetical protein TeGR_g14814 [Tetraparma gracilis]